MLRNLQIERANSIQTYYLLIIRASNLTSHWTTQTAVIEATALLKSDTGLSFVNSQYFIQLSAIPELTSLLENIKGNLTNPNYTSTEYLADLQKVQAIAKQYDVSNNILNELIQFVNAQATGVLPTFATNTYPA